MKNINSIISGITTAVVCLVMSMSVFGQNKVDLNLATRVGENFVKMNGRIALSGEAGSLQRVQTDKFPNLYIFNADGHGWIIVAGDKRMQPILGFSDEGTFDPNDMAPAAEMIIGSYDYVVDSLVRYNARTTDESVAQAWRDFERGYYENNEKGNREDEPQYPLAVSPLITTNWGQGKPYPDIYPNGWQNNYNQYCPWVDLTNNNNGNTYTFRTITGCVATAMAQLLYYFKINISNILISACFLKDKNDPDNPIIYSIYDAYNQERWSEDYTDNTSFSNYQNWDFYIGDWDYSKSYSRELAAKMMRDCGLSINTRYGLGFSGGYAEGALWSFQNLFGFDKAEIIYRGNNTNEWKSQLKKYIRNEVPLFYSGRKYTGLYDNQGNPKTVGHAYILDGYLTDYYDTYFHHNLGWDDNSNAYFSVDYKYPLDQSFIGLIPIQDYDIHKSKTIVFGASDDIEACQMTYHVEWGPIMSVSVTDRTIIYNTPGDYILYDKCFDGYGWTPEINVFIHVKVLPASINPVTKTGEACKGHSFTKKYTDNGNEFVFLLPPDSTDYDGSHNFVRYSYDKVSGVMNGKCVLTLTTKNCDSNCTPDVSCLNNGTNGSKDGQSTNQIIYNSVTKYYEYKNAMDGFLSRVLMEAYWFDKEKGIEFWNLLQSLLDSNTGMITEEGIQQLINQSPLENISDDYIRVIAEGYNQSVLYWNEGYYTNDSLPEGYGGMIEYDTAAMRKAYEAQAYAESLGFSDVRQMYDNAYEMLETEIENIQSEVCARVTVQFNQKMTMTREAFNGTLQIFNGHESTPMEDILVDFRIEDQQGNDCTNLFQINTLALDQITGISGDGSLAAQTNGTVLVQFIPTKNAAPTEPKFYSFGGSFSFIDPFTGEGLTYPLYPVEITVNPSPDLYVDYFMQRDILGDDALTTDVVEPSVPAELGVIIHNQGAGEAKNVTLETAEPQIIDNEHGLAIDFAMYGASFNGTPRQLGLMEIPFGNIGSGQTAVGEWLFTSSLLGHFVSYDAHVIHNSSYGNSDLSLVSHLDIHELIHPIYAYGNLDDDINDFLVNDNPDAYDTPDSIYFSHGGKTSVGVVDGISFDHLVSPSDTIVTLTVVPSRVGWNYGVTDDPGMNQYNIVSCIRNNDNQEIPLNNVWQTFVTIPDGGDPVYENKLHIVDTIPVQQTTTYTLVFAKKPSNLRIFHGNEDEYWSNVANWEGYILPQADDEVLINGICELDEDAEVFSLTVAENKALAIPDGRILTVSGSLINAEASGLVIEEGGQLMHTNTGAQGTVQKNILPYTVGTKDGWYLVASPLVGNTAVASVADMLNNNYDLYYYDEPTHYWINEKDASNHFTELTNGKGYLYANNEEVLLGFEGELQSGSAIITVLLNYTDGIDLAGFNLVGNPYAHNVTSYGSVNVANGCFVMNEAKDDFIVSEISEANPLKPAEGFFVKAVDEGASITFNSGRGTTANHNGSIYVELLYDSKLIDRLIVKSEGDPLRKFSLNNGRAKVFAMLDHREVAIVPCEGNEQPVNFKAVKNGTFTINVNVNNLEFDYLHLIDNLTGADVDLLVEPSYTFEAKTTDYDSRFKLVFSVSGDENDEDAPFAFINNGNIIIIGAEDGAILQIVDVMGRVLVSTDNVSNVSTNGMAKGVYILRLIKSDDVRTQKIVID